MCSINEITPLLVKAGYKTLCLLLLHYPHKIKLVHSSHYSRTDNSMVWQQQPICYDNIIIVDWNNLEDNTV